MTNSVPIEFKYGETKITEAAPLTGTIANSQVSAETTTITVDWEWVTADLDNDIDYADSASEFTITIVARQVLDGDAPLEP